MEWRLYSRDRVAMFWTMAFPVILLLGFGTIFRDSGGPKLSVVRVLAAAPGPQDAALDLALADLQLKVQALPRAEAEARWARGETAAQLEAEGGGYRLRLNSYLMAQAGATAGLVNQAWLVAQARLSGAPEPRRIPIQVESPGRKRSANYAAFLLPGLLGLNLVSMGLFSVGMVNVSYREKGKFRRLAVTPLPKWIFLLGQVIHRLTVTVIQAAILLLVGYLVFGIANQGSFLELLLVMALGTGCFMAFGFALSGFAETSEGYAAISNLVDLGGHWGQGQGYTGGLEYPCRLQSAPGRPSFSRSSWTSWASASSSRSCPSTPRPLRTIPAPGWRPSTTCWG
ncbi:MAG: ABC transporter permease [Acidobacteria bacterium]|nr:ABC transporter permease [Acidobacteriota bacterium]